MRQTRPKHILLLNTLYPPYSLGGAERSVEILAKSLLQRGLRISLLTLTEMGVEAREDVDGVEVYRIPLRNIYWPFIESSHQSSAHRALWHLLDNYNPLQAKLVGSALDKLQPDIVHTNNLAGFSVAAWRECANRKVPIIHTARDYYLLHPNATLHGRNGPQSERSLSSRGWSATKKRASRLVSSFVGISDYVRDIHIRSGFFKNATNHVIYNSLEAPASRPPRRAFTGTFGFLGRLDPTKGLEVALEAMRYHENYSLIVAGSGESSYSSHLHSIAPPNVKFIGRQKSDHFFRQIDALIVPSIWAEPLGRVVIEAYSNGVPVIASRIGGLLDTVNQRTGLHFTPGDSESLASCMSTISSSKIDYYSNCISYSLGFSSSEICDSYFDLYDSMTCM